MMSTTMMTVLIGVYAVIAVASAFELNWPRALYWCGAIIITWSVLWMQ